MTTFAHANSVSLESMELTLFAEPWQVLWKGAESAERIGAVYTKPEIVDLILDLAGYRIGRQRLAERRLLEPGCGDGAFISRIVARLLLSEQRRSSRIKWSDNVLDDAIRAVDISEASLAAARGVIVAALGEVGCPPQRAAALAERWTLHADFLLHDFGGQQFDFVIGNPPYVRIEELPKGVLARYRTNYETMADRADVYVGFMERGLQLLANCGALGFITANRFAKNAYGATLRKIIASRYRVRYYLNLEHTQPYAAEVSAYPAITIVDRLRNKPTRAGTLADISPRALSALRKAATARTARAPLAEFSDWYSDGGPWTTTCRKAFGVLGRLNEKFPTLELSAPGPRVGIGVATGADRVFVLRGKSAEIEESRQIPLVMAADIAPAGISWSGHYLVNPFADEDDGSLVRLADYPGLAEHLEAEANLLRGRHVSKSRPAVWYRTIDRIWPSLQRRPKLLIPDIQGGGVVGVDEGNYYPHHNVYTVASDTWPLRALQALLRSSFVLQQVSGFSVQMRGGSLRYMARTLRQIRIPQLDSIDPRVVDELESVGSSPDQAAIDAVARKAYGPSL